MIGYVLLGTNDVSKSGAFYDALLGEMGVRRLMDTGRGHLWGASLQDLWLGVQIPFDKQAATYGNGAMVAFKANNRAQVDALYAKAMALGATDEGPPGQRVEGFYAAYFRDLDGNKLNFYYMGP